MSYIHIRQKPLPVILLHHHHDFEHLECRGASFLQLNLLQWTEYAASLLSVHPWQPQNVFPMCLLYFCGFSFSFFCSPVSLLRHCCFLRRGKRKWTSWKLIGMKDMAIRICSFLMEEDEWTSWKLIGKKGHELKPVTLNLRTWSERHWNW